MSSLGLIINKRSDRSQSLVDDLLYVANGAGDVCAEVLDGINGLGDALDSMNRRKVETLVLAGGDGTMQATFTDAINHNRFEHMPSYVALPCGMTNVIAADCGLAGAPAESLDHFLWRQRQGEAKPLTRPLLSVTGAIGQAPIYGFFFGAGAFCSAVRYSRDKVQATGAKRTIAMVAGTLGYGFKAARNPRKVIEPVDLILQSDGAGAVKSEGLRTIALATTLRKLGGGIYPFWGGKDGPMATTMVDYPVRKMWRGAPAVLLSKELKWFKEEGYHSWRGQASRLSFDGEFVFDGEFFEARKSQPLQLETTYNVNFLN